MSDRLAQQLNEWAKKQNHQSIEESVRDFEGIFESSATDILYFFTLARQALTGVAKPKIPLADKSSDLDHLMAHPYSILSEESARQIPVKSYSSLLEEEDSYQEAAQDCTLIIERLQAGTGTSFSRRRYLSHMLGKPVEEVVESSKGVDLIVPAERTPIQLGEPLSIAELQLLQEIKLQKNSSFGLLKHRDLVGPETAEGLQAIWQKTIPNTDISYEDYFSHTDNLEPLKPYRQDFRPTLNEGGEFTTDRMAPPGHGLFGFKAILDLVDTKGENLSNTFLVISNGEDLNGLPPASTIGWMKQQNIPILMVTTEKTALDLKGGQIALCQGDGVSPYVAIVERAQAAEFGQTEYFEQLGLRATDRPALFNTNMVILQLDRLKTLLDKILSRTGKSALQLAMDVAPDLIRNTKEQTVHGQKQLRTQLEGAMGSVYLNFDRIARKVMGRPAVQFLQVEEPYRTEFFAPIKTAFDFYQLYHSDKFYIDESFRLKRNGSSPLAAFEPLNSQVSQHYSDLQNLLEDFAGAKIKELTTLRLNSPLKLSGKKLQGDVSI